MMETAVNPTNGAGGGTNNEPLVMGALSNYKDIDRCMSETAHFDEMSSFMSLFDGDSGERVISPSDSYENAVNGPLPQLLGNHLRNQMGLVSGQMQRYENHHEHFSDAGADAYNNFHHSN